jgi:hypothetical protein
MSARFAKGSPWLLASILTLLGCGTARASAWVLAPGEFYSEVRGSYASSKNFFDATGERPGLGGGGSFDTRSMRWSSELGWKKRMSFRIDLPFRSVSRQYAADAEFTTTGLSDLVVGVKYRIMNGLSLEADWKAPLGYNRSLYPALLDSAETGGSHAPQGHTRALYYPGFGDGRQDIAGMLQFGTAIRPLQAFFEVGGGYRKRIDGFKGDLEPQDEVLASADLGWWIGHSVMLAGNYLGRFESSSARFPVKEHRVGPEILYRVDDGIDVFAGSFHTASGENVLHTDQYYVGVAAKKSGLDRLKGFLGSTKRP